CRLPDLLNHGDELFRLAPIEELEISGDHSLLELAPLVNSPWFHRIRRLKFALARLDREAVNHLQAAPQLTDLDLRSTSLPLEALIALFQPPLMARLTRLGVHVVAESVGEHVRAAVTEVGGP